MYTLYRIINKISGRSYIGMTKNSLSFRFKSHKWAATSGKKSPLYNAIRSYGLENFEINKLSEYVTKQDCCEAEVAAIVGEDNLYNLAKGGEGGFTVSNIVEWKKKLSKAREGRKPALGMKHTEENKKLFSECAKRRVKKYPTILPASFKEASAILGISKTHYYRLIRRARCNEPS